MRLPDKLKRSSTAVRAERSCPGHRAWVRKHHCSVPGCDRRPIECAHVRRGTGGGMGLKPPDRWVVSLCSHHHAEQHRLGERRFEQRYQIELAALAREFARRSPHRKTLEAI